jgi:hypothetical protein
VNYLQNLTYSSTTTTITIMPDIVVVAAAYIVTAKVTTVLGHMITTDASDLSLRRLGS